MNKPKIGEYIMNLGGGAYVKTILSDSQVIATYYGMTQTVNITRVLDGPLSAL